MNKVKALQFQSVGKPLQYTDVATPEGERVLRVQAAALNHRDLWITKGQYPGIQAGITLGSDGLAIDDNGQEYLINPNIDWGEDERVQSAAYHILGMPTSGTFAEYVAVGRDRLYPKPAHLLAKEAAALPLAGLTAYRAVFVRGRWQPGQQVLISGIGGGVALMAAQFLLSVGADVYVTSSSDAKLERALQLGVKGTANYRYEKWGKLLKAESGLFDLIIDSAGGEGFQELVHLAKPGGSIVFYGGTRGVIPLNPQQVFWKQLNILGSTMGSDEDFVQMLAFVEKNSVRPVVDSVFAFHDYEAAFARMEKGEQFGKIVLTHE